MSPPQERHYRRCQQGHEGDEPDEAVLPERNHPETVCDYEISPLVIMLSIPAPPPPAKDRSLPCLVYHEFFTEDSVFQRFGPFNTYGCDEIHRRLSIPAPHGPQGSVSDGKCG